MTHVPPDTDRVREARVVVVVPVDDPRSEPTPTTGVDIDTDTGDGDGGPANGDGACWCWTCTWVACVIVVVAMVLVWLAALAVRFGWTSKAITFATTASYVAVDMSICDVDQLRAMQWAALTVTICLSDFFWRDGIASIVAIALRLVGACALYRRQEWMHGSAARFIWIMSYIFCAKTLLVTYGYL